MRTNKLSSYLVQPSARPDRAAQWNGFRTQYFTIKRANPHLLRNSLLILSVWCACIASVQTLTHSGAAADNFTITNLPKAGSQLGSAPAAQTAAAAPAATAKPASLAAGPSGQLTPPSSVPAATVQLASASLMAPFGTYRNNYAWGQCTWYVASRRQVPPNWGNANSWYYHAISTGWKVGTIPSVGAIAWTGAGYYGHVALVEQVSADGRQVYVSEMNYRGVGVKSYRWTSSSSFKYIY